jgi:hypothetical protein
VHQRLLSRALRSTKLIQPTLFKSRVWFIEKDTLKAWYLPTASVGGAAQALDLSSVAHLGGNVGGNGRVDN